MIIYLCRISRSSYICVGYRGDHIICVGYRSGHVLVWDIEVVMYLCGISR